MIENSNQTATDYIKGFRFLRNLLNFKKIEKKNYIIFLIQQKFTDAKKFLKKSMRDQHFSIVSYYLKKQQNLKRITNVQEISDCLNNYQDKSNKRNINNNVLTINYLAIVMPSITDNITINKLKINQIESLFKI